MRSIVASIGILLLSSIYANAAELQYRWKAGQTSVYTVTSKTKTKMDMGPMAPAAMGGDFEATMKATFALKVKRVRSNGTAEGVLTIRSFKVIDAKGRVMAGLKGLPPGALKNSVDIDAKGRFKFKEVMDQMDQGISFKPKI